MAERALYLPRGRQTDSRRENGREKVKNANFLVSNAEGIGRREIYCLLIRI